MANHFSSLKRATPGAPGLWNHVNFDFEAAEREIRRRRNCLNLDVVEEELKGSAISEELKQSMRALLEGEVRDRDEPMSGLEAAARREGGPPSPRRGGLLETEGRKARLRSEATCPSPGSLSSLGDMRGCGAPGVASLSAPARRVRGSPQEG